MLKLAAGDEIGDAHSSADVLLAMAAAMIEFVVTIKVSVMYEIGQDTIPQYSTDEAT